MLKKYIFKPGINRDISSYTGEGGWFWCNRVRFKNGMPESIGGWVSIITGAFLGICKAIFSWSLLSGNSLIALGTNLKFYIIQGGTLNDVTPIRATTNPLGANPFASTNGSKELIVTDATNAPAANDFVDFSGAVGFAGIPAGDINTSLQVTRVVSGTTYAVNVATTANATTTGGGAAVRADYEIHVGPAIETSGVGWGAGGYGNSGWGQSVGSGATSSMRLWSIDNFGQDLVFADTTGVIYYWSAAGGVTTRAVLLSTMGGASDVPTIVNSIFVADDHHVIACGVNPIGSGTLDPMFIRWSDTENATQWTPLVTNTAGGQRLDEGSYIVKGTKSKGNNLIWTDSALYAMTFIGAPLVYSIQLVDKNLSIVSPNAFAQINNNVYWMGHGKFYSYDGRVNTLYCPIRDYIFDPLYSGHREPAWIDTAQNQQIYCGTNQQYNEIVWVYKSVGSTTGYCDRYIMYNYLEEVWYFGSLDRTAWFDSAVFGGPLATSTGLISDVTGVLTGNTTLNAGNLYQHEIGNPATVSVNTAPTIVSSDFDIDDGDHLAFVKRILPDLNFSGSNFNGTPGINVILASKPDSGTWNTQANLTGGGSSTVRTVANSTRVINGTTVFPTSESIFTGNLYVRIRGRQFNLQIATIPADGGDTKWQLGGIRLDIQPDGRKI